MLIPAKIKTIIIEDNIQAQEYLANIITNNFDTIEILGYADNIVSASRLINTIKPELVFMDIELKDGNSFEIFNTISTHDFEVIFVTAFDDYLKKAIDHYAFSFILKPIVEDKLIKIVSRFINLNNRLFSKSKYLLLTDFLKTKDSQFLIQVGHNYVSIKISDIIKCVAEGNYTSFYLNNGKKLLASNSLKYFEGLIIDKGFFKANRSTIINIHHIDSIYKKETIILKNKDKVNVSARNKSNLTQLINFFS